MTDIKITIRLFGAFRQYGENISFTMPAGCTVAAVKQKLGDVLKADQQLIGDSALANDNEIIDDLSTVLTQDSHLAILPPVCGG